MDYKFIKKPKYKEIIDDCFVAMQDDIFKFNQYAQSLGVFDGISGYLYLLAIAEDLGYRTKHI